MAWNGTVAIGKREMTGSEMEFRSLAIVFLLLWAKCEKMKTIHFASGSSLRAGAAGRLLVVDKR